MKKIFWGFFLIFLDFYINIGACRIGFLPDFLGYYFLIQGMRQLERETPRFEGCYSPAMAMTVYSVILYLLDLVGLSGSLGLMGTVLGLIAMVVSYYLSYRIIEGIRDIESRRGADLRGARLQTCLLVLVIANVCSFFFTLAGAAFLAISGLLVVLAAIICFLAAVYGSWKQYEALPPLDGPSAGFPAE